MINVQGLNFSYPTKGAVTGRPTIDNISFTTGLGEIFGFLGPSGSGKSTTQKILCGLLSHYHGQISIAEKPLSSWSRDYYKLIGVGFELPNHFNKLSAKENLDLFASFYGAQCIKPMELLERLGLSDVANKPVSTFSKGMKMRLNFARCLIHKPKLIFLDEPTSGLDPINARKIKALILEEKAKGHTIFLTTHSMQDADDLCDRVALLNDGKIVAMDTPKALKLQYGEASVKVRYFLANDPTSPLQTACFDISSLNNNHAFLQIVNECQIESIHSQEASLEEVFIQATGRSIL